jgi:hypothetical protein
MVLYKKNQTDIMYVGGQVLYEFGRCKKNPVTFATGF